MMTIFGLLPTYEAATTIVDELMTAGAEPSELNALVKSGIAKETMDLNLARAGVAVTDEVGDIEIHGLERLVGGEQPVPLPGLGDVYAAGELATLMATAAQARREEGRGMEPAFREFQLPASAATAFYEGIDGGDWLIFVRADDDKAQELVSVFRLHTEDVTTITG